MNRSLASLASLSLLALLLNGCTSGSGMENTQNPPPPVDDDEDANTIQYNGPTPSTNDVVNFYQHVWRELALPTRCGACHNEEVGQDPMFVRADDINLAYTAANAYVDLSEPVMSRLVTKVATGHNCWTANTGFCEEKIEEWITNWATNSGVELTQTALRVPDVIEVSASLTFDTDPSAFETHVYPMFTAYCADCHRGDAPQAPVQPYFASTDVFVAYEAAQTKMLFNVTELEGGGVDIDASRSRLVVRLREEAHNCWDNNCVTSGNAMEQGLEAFAATLQMRDLDSSLVTSKAMRIGDGTAISQGGRVETNAIAIYPFKAGAGNVANDYSDGFPPALDLYLYDDVEWVSNWGLRFNNGRAQGSVAASEKLHKYITQTGEYSIEAWVVPANVTQEGPARIVSYSGSDNERNFTLGQTLYNYNFMNRSSTTDINGAPMVSTADADEVLQATLQHVVASYDPLEGRKLYVNGTEVISQDPSGAGLLNEWDDSFALILGNETSGEYPWRGTIRFLAIHNRALTLEQAQTNYDVGVGQKILLAFSISEHIPNMSDAYIVFQVEQFDDYSYLFTDPYFFSFTEIPASDITIRGLHIGVNGREAGIGQAFANIDVVISADNYNVDGTPLSDLGAVIQLEKGSEQDQFFLSFDQVGTSNFTRTEPAPAVPEEAQDIPGQPDIGVRTFAEINASLSEMTGIPVTNSGVAQTYDAVKQQMPSVEDVKGFLVAHQMGITQLSVKYCNTLVSDSSRMNTFFPNFSGTFDAAGRAGIIDPLLEVLVAHAIPGEGQLSNQPLVSDTHTRMNDLMDTMTATCGGGVCSAQVTQNTVTAVCAAALGSAVMLVQ